MNSPPGRKDQLPDIGTLFEGATPRPKASATDRDAVFRSAHAAWVQTVAARRRRAQRRLGFGGALAAGLLLAITLFNRGPSVAPVPTVVATLHDVRGDVMLGRANDAIWRPLDPDTGALTSGTRLRTLEGTVRLRLNDQVSLRLNRDSVVTLIQVHAVDLKQGQLYVDSGPLHAQLSIATPVGIVRNEGTEFQVTIEDNAVSVAVRTGRVVLRGTDGREVATDAAEQQRFFGDGTAPLRRPLAVDDAIWSWADALAPDFALDGRSPLEYLEWVAVETGSVLTFASPEARRRAQSDIYHGAGSAGASARTMAIALRSAGLQASQSNGELIVSLRN